MIEKNVCSVFSKVITYHSYSDKRIETIVVTKAETQGCNVNQNKDLTVSIKVPALPPTDFLTSNVIKVKYFIRVRNLIIVENIVLISKF